MDKMNEVNGHRQSPVKSGRGRGRGGRGRGIGRMAVTKAVAPKKPAASSGRGRGRGRYYVDSRVQAASERQKDLKANYAALANAIKPALEELASRNLELLKTSHDAHKEVDAYKDIVNFLDSRRDDAMAKVNNAYRFGEENRKSLYEIEVAQTKASIAKRCDEAMDNFIDASLRRLDILENLHNLGRPVDVTDESWVFATQTGYVRELPPETTKRKADGQPDGQPQRKRHIGGLLSAVVSQSEAGADSNAASPTPGEEPGDEEQTAAAKLVANENLPLPIPKSATEADEYGFRTLHKKRPGKDQRDVMIPPLYEYEDYEIGWRDGCNDSTRTATKAKRGPYLNKPNTDHWFLDRTVWAYDLFTEKPENYDQDLVRKHNLHPRFAVLHKDSVIPEEPPKPRVDGTKPTILHTFEGNYVHASRTMRLAKLDQYMQGRDKKRAFKAAFSQFCADEDVSAEDIKPDEAVVVGRFPANPKSGASIISFARGRSSANDVDTEDEEPQQIPQLNPAHELLTPADARQVDQQIKNLLDAADVVADEADSAGRASAAAPRPFDPIRDVDFAGPSLREQNRELSKDAEKSGSLLALATVALMGSEPVQAPGDVAERSLAEQIAGRPESSGPALPFFHTESALAARPPSPPLPFPTSEKNSHLDPILSSLAEPSPRRVMDSAAVATHPPRSPPQSRDSDPHPLPAFLRLADPALAPLPETDLPFAPVIEAATRPNEPQRGRLNTVNIHARPEPADARDFPDEDAQPYYLDDFREQEASYHAEGTQPENMPESSSPASAPEAGSMLDPRLMAGPPQEHEQRGDYYPDGAEYPPYAPPPHQSQYVTSGSAPFGRQPDGPPPGRVPFSNPNAADVPSLPPQHGARHPADSYNGRKYDSVPMPPPIHESGHYQQPSHYQEPYGGYGPQDSYRPYQQPPPHGSYPPSYHQEYPPQRPYQQPPPLQYPSQPAQSYNDPHYQAPQYTHSPQTYEMPAFPQSGVPPHPSQAYPDAGSRPDSQHDPRRSHSSDSFPLSHVRGSTHPGSGESRDKPGSHLRGASLSGSSTSNSKYRELRAAPLPPHRAGMSPALFRNVMYEPKEVIKDYPVVDQPPPPSSNKAMKIRGWTHNSMKQKRETPKKVWMDEHGITHEYEPGTEPPDEPRKRPE